MTANSYLERWDLIQISIKNESFIVLDKLVNRKRAYHVPFLINAEIIGQSVYIFTSNSKIMELNLSTASRQFLSISQLKELKEFQQAHNTFQFEKNSLNLITNTLKDIAHLPLYAFTNTVNVN